MKLRMHYIAVLAVGLYVGIADGASPHEALRIQYNDLTTRGSSIVKHCAEPGYYDRGVTVLRSNLGQTESLRTQIEALRKSGDMKGYENWKSVLLKLESQLCQTQILTRKALDGSVQNPKTISSLIVSLPLLGNPLLGQQFLVEQ